jgi:hypothetical protein
MQKHAWTPFHVRAGVDGRLLGVPKLGALQAATAAPAIWSYWRGLLLRARWSGDLA